MSLNDIDRLIFNNSSGNRVDVPWGTITKGDFITRMFHKDAEIIRERFSLEGVSGSVAIGEMQPGVFHKPYIRHAGKNVG